MEAKHVAPGQAQINFGGWIGGGTFEQPPDTGPEFHGSVAPARNLDQTKGNIMTRNEYLQYVIRRLVANDQPVTLETVTRRVSPEIARDLTDDEVCRAHAAVEEIELSTANHAAEKSAAAPANATTETEALAAVKAAQQSLAERRALVRQRTGELQTARGELHTRIRAYLAGSEQFTPLDAARDFQRTAQAQRQARAAAGLHGTSATANAYVRKRMANPTRGGFPSSWKGRVDPRYVPPESK